MTHQLSAKPAQADIPAPDPQAAADDIDRPIFFIGAPRSGTTIVFEAFSAHADLAWFSNFLHKFPRYPVVSLASRIAISNRLLGTKQQGVQQGRFRFPLPHAIECYPVWDRCCGEKFRYDYLINQQASESEKRKARALVAKVTKYQGKERFTAKITGPSRICYLSSIFPDALFIHIIRDGRAVADSLMNVRFWKEGGGYERPWWKGGLTAEDLEIYTRHNRSPLALAALQWRRIILVARQEAEQLQASRYTELRYEHAVREPHFFIDKLIEFAQLEPSAKVHEYVSRKSSFQDMNFKYRQHFSSQDLAMLEDILGDVNSRLGVPTDIKFRPDPGQ